MKIQVQGQSGPTEEIRYLKLIQADEVVTLIATSKDGSPVGGGNLMEFHANGTFRRIGSVCVEPFGPDKMQERE